MFLVAFLCLQFLFKFSSGTNIGNKVACKMLMKSKLTPETWASSDPWCRWSVRRQWGRSRRWLRRRSYSPRGRRSSKSFHRRLRSTAWNSWWQRSWWVWRFRERIHLSESNRILRELLPIIQFNSIFMIPDVRTTTISQFMIYSYVRESP